MFGHIVFLVDAPFLLKVRSIFWCTELYDPQKNLIFRVFHKIRGVYQRPDLEVKVSPRKLTTEGKPGRDLVNSDQTHDTSGVRS